MSYRNKTYVIFDGDNDMWAYAFMKGWNSREHMDFDFHDAHELNTLRPDTAEETVKAKLRERLRSAKQAIVIVGEKTRNLYRYVRWEIECCLELGIPIVVVNLNGKRSLDSDLCPPILKGKPCMHVSFKMNIIKFAMDDFCGDFESKYRHTNDWYYYDQTYTKVGAD